MRKLLILFICCLLIISCAAGEELIDDPVTYLTESEQLINPGVYFVGTDIQKGIFEIRLLPSSKYSATLFIFDSLEQYQEFYISRSGAVPKAEIFISKKHLDISYHFSLDEDDILWIREPDYYAIKRITTVY